MNNQLNGRIENMCHTKPQIVPLGSTIEAIQGTIIITKIGHLCDEASGHQGEPNQAVLNSYEADE